MAMRGSLTRVDFKRGMAYLAKHPQRTCTSKGILIFAEVLLVALLLTNCPGVALQFKLLRPV